MWQSEDNLCGVSCSFHPMVLDWTQVVRPGSKHLCCWDISPAWLLKKCLMYNNFRFTEELWLVPAQFHPTGFPSPASSICIVRTRLASQSSVRISTDWTQHLFSLPGAMWHPWCSHSPCLLWPLLAEAISKDSWCLDIHNSQVYHLPVW